MVETLLRAASFLCAFSGMSWLALAMKPHWSQVRAGSQRSEGAPTRLRILGALGLFASLVLCLAADHRSIALLVWVMTVIASALLVTLTLAYAPRALSWLTSVAESPRRPGG